MKIGGDCHCGATRFELAYAPEKVTYCTCSNCSKRGALWAYYAPRDVTISSEEGAGIYQWGARIGRFHFCSKCGCSTYGESPDWSTGQADFANPRISINARLIDDFDPDAIPVEVLDGKNLW